MPANRGVPMKEIVIAGKGGIGKSTIVTNLAVLAARRGMKVLQVGCDPKHDSCSRHLDRRPPTVMDLFKEKGRVDREDIEGLVARGRTGVYCIEAGGPSPGEGCAGRAISLLLEFMRSAGNLFERYDLVIYDLLGDVVCGGFAAPIRRGPDTRILLVTSGEILPIFAANNIAHGIRNLFRRRGGRLGGIIANLRGTPGEREILTRFAAGLGSRVIGWIPRDPAVFAAEQARRTLLEHAPDSPAARAIEALARRILDETPELVVPTPLEEDSFEALFLPWREGETR